MAGSDVFGVEARPRVGEESEGEVSILNEVDILKCPTCGSPLNEHWRGRACLETPPGPELRATHTEQREKLARLKAVCDAATAGPWTHRIDRDWPKPDRIIETPEGFVIIRDENCEQHFKLDRDHTNFEFIATARTELPALIEAHIAALDEVERLKAAGKVLVRHGQCASGLFGDLEEYRKARRVFEEGE